MSEAHYCAPPALRQAHLCAAQICAPSGTLLHMHNDPERLEELREQAREWLRRACALTGWKPSQLAKAAGLAPSTVNRFLKSDVDHVLSTKTVAAILEAVERQIRATKASPAENKRRLEELLELRQMLGGGATGDRRQQQPSVLIVGAVQAGGYTAALELPESDHYPSGLPYDRRYAGLPQFALEVRGNSVDELYPDGSTVQCIKFLDLHRRPQPGELVVVWRRDPHHDGGEATLKELRTASDGSYWLWPRSTDPRHQPFELKGLDDASDDNDDVVVVALVIGGYRAEAPRA